MTATIAQLAAFAHSHGDCKLTLDWLATLDQSASAQSAWEACSEPDWLFWFASRAGVTGNIYAEIACDVAEKIALSHDQSDIAIVTDTIATVRRYMRGEASRADLDAAAVAAARVNAAPRAALAAAEAALWTADAGLAAERAGLAVVRAAKAAAWAVAHTAKRAANDAERDAARAATAAAKRVVACNIIRAHIPWSQIEPAIIGVTP